MGVRCPFFAARIYGSSVRILLPKLSVPVRYIFPAKLQQCACTLRIFGGCLQDKMHCLGMYSSPREQAEFQVEQKSNTISRC